MGSKFDEKWLEQAVRVEDEAGCDIEAGFNLGQHVAAYLIERQGYIDREKLMSILQEQWRSLLSQEDLEAAMNAAQNFARDRVKEKLQSSDVA